MPGSTASVAAWSRICGARDSICVIGRTLAAAGSPVKSRQRTERRVGERHRLEEPAHAARRNRRKTSERGVDLSGAGVFKAGLELGGPSVDAQATEKLALPDRPMHARAGAARGRGERREIHMRGEIDLARIAQRIREGVAADRLQGLAEPALDVAIVNCQTPAPATRQ